MNRAITCALLLAACGGASNTAPGDGPEPGSDAGPVTPDPPSDVHAEAGERDHCVLAWTPPPQEVDGYEIATDARGWSFDDADTHGGIAPRGAMAVLDFSQSSLGELSPVAIRIRSRNHGRMSAFTAPVTCRLPVRAPLFVTVTLEPDGFALGWDALSRVAVRYEVERARLDASGAPGAWAALASLPAPAPNDPSAIDQHLTDSAALPAGSAYAYRVSAVAPGGERGTSGLTRSATLGAALTTSTVTLPPSIVTVADRAGHYATFSAQADGFVYTWGTGAPFTSSPVIAASPYAPFVKLDALGLPHAVYGKSVGGANNITHGWSDGTQWHEETIATRSPSATTATPSLSFDLDATGTPVLMWRLSNINASYEVAHKSAGTWIIQPLSALTIAQVFGSYTVFTDASGVVHLALAAALDLHHLQLTNDTWTDEHAPGEPTFGLLLATGRDPAHLAICYDDFGVPTCVRKTPAGWGALERLSPLPSSLSLDGIGWLAMADDGNRLALLHQDAGSQLFRSDARGRWNEIAFPRLDAGAFEPTQFLGFDAAGKLFILVDPNAAIDRTATTVAYERRAEP